MKRALIVATTASMIDQFNRNNIDVLMSMGYEVHIACNFKEGNTTSKERINFFREEMQEMKVSIFDVPIQRAPFAYGKNIWSCLLLKEIIEKCKYKLIHCHTPMGGVVARIAAMGISKWGGKIIYTAHGFHFYKGCPWQNSLVYKNVERIMARCTDNLITINHEDFAAAKNFSLKRQGKVFYVPGVGVDTEKIKNTKVDFYNKRKEFEIPERAILILSVGELNRNKNHEVIIRAISEIDNGDIYYLICGQGNLENHLKKIAKDLNIDNRIIIPGFREDVAQVLKIADIFAFPTIREGLGLAAIEAMAAGLPIVCSKNRGSVDYISNTKNGFMCECDDVAGFASAIKALIEKKEWVTKMGLANQNIAKNFDSKIIKAKLEKIYGDF